jgi:hypothetical protein
VLCHVFDLVEDTALMRYPLIRWRPGATLALHGMIKARGRGGLLQYAYALGARMACAMLGPILMPSFYTENL